MVVFYLSFFTTILLGNKTFIEIGNLTHFSKYTLTIKACHKSLNDTDWNALNPFIAKASYDENHKARCSKIQSSDFLTAKKEGADDIPSDSVTTNSDSNNGMNYYPHIIIAERVPEIRVSGTREVPWKNGGPEYLKKSRQINS